MAQPHAERAAAHRVARAARPLLQAGSSEILRDEAVRTAQRAYEASVDVELELWPRTPHAFQMASFLPEAAQAIDRIVGFVVARTGWSAAA